SSLNAESPAYYSVLQQPTGADAQALSVLEREIAERHRQGERPRIEGVGVSGPWQNVAMARGLEATNGYNPLRIGSYDRLVSPGETTYIVNQRLFPASFDGYDCALARELGLEYVVLGRPIDEVPHLPRRPVLDVLMAGPKIWIYRRRGKAQSPAKFVKTGTVPKPNAQVPPAQFPPKPLAQTPQNTHTHRPRAAIGQHHSGQRRVTPRSSPGTPTGWRSRSTTSSPASSSCTRPTTQVGSRRSMAGPRQSCAPTCSSAAWRWAKDATASRSASSPSRSRTCATR